MKKLLIFFLSLIPFFAFAQNPVNPVQVNQNTFYRDLATGKYWIYSGTTLGYRLQADSFTTNFKNLGTTKVPIIELADTIKKGNWVIYNPSSTVGTMTIIGDNHLNATPRIVQVINNLNHLTVWGVNIFGIAYGGGIASNAGANMGLVSTNSTGTTISSYKANGDTVLKVINSNRSSTGATLALGDSTSTGVKYRLVVPHGALSNSVSVGDSSLMIDVNGNVKKGIGGAVYAPGDGIKITSNVISIDTSVVQRLNPTYINQTATDVMTIRSLDRNAGTVRAKQVLNPGTVGQGFKYQSSSQTQIWNETGSDYFVDVYTSTNHGLTFTLIQSNAHAIAGTVFITGGAYTLITDHSVSPVLPIIYPAIGGGGTTTHPLTMNNSGSGDASGSLFDGSVAKTISYNSIGAQPLLVSGTNLKTINSASLLGSSNILLQTPLVAGTDYLAPTGSAALLTSFPTLNQNTSGNAATATALQTARAINGVNFDGTAPITIPAAAGTVTGTTLNSTVVTSSLTTIGTLIAGSIPYSLLTGTPSSLPPSGTAAGELAGTYPNPTLLNSAVIGKVLTGYTSGAGTVSATDNILQAIQKLNGNIGGLSSIYQPLEDQRLSTTNSPSFVKGSLTGTAGNGYLDLGTQSASPASLTNHLRIYSDSLNRISWKNSLYRRTIQVPYPSDYTIRMPYRVTGTTLEDSTHAVTTYVPQTRTLTINGTTLDLSANRSWTVTATNLSAQSITSGTTATVTGGNYRVYIDPSSTIASFTLTLPASPSDGDIVKVYFGGTLTSGTIVTALVVSPNSGQTILDNTPPVNATADNILIYTYRTSNTKWNREKP